MCSMILRWIITPVAFVAFVASAVFAALAAASAAFAAHAAASAVHAALAAAAAAFALTEKENLPYWRVMVVLLGEAGAILGWMLLWQHSLPLAAGTLAAGVGIMALAAFADVSEPENKAAAVGQ